MIKEPEAKKKQPVAPDLQALRLWYQSPLGRLVTSLEIRELKAILPDLFGFYLLQVGQFSAKDLLFSSRVLQKVILDPEPQPVPGYLTVVGDTNNLAVATVGLDLLVLHHSLEWVADPHRLIREVERVLIAEGHVVIVGFNPWSIWGLKRLLIPKKRRCVPDKARYISLTRLKDWLSLLGFDIVESRPYLFRLPIQHKGLMRRLRFLDKLGRRWWPFLSGGYVVVAKKRVTTLTPIKPSWLQRTRFINVAKPSAAQNNERYK